MPEDKLERAAQVWARTEKFMPKASELIALCNKPQFGNDGERIQRLRAACDHANAHLASIGRAHELEWVILNGTTHIQWKR